VAPGVQSLALRASGSAALASLHPFRRRSKCIHWLSCEPDYPRRSCLLRSSLRLGLRCAGTLHPTFGGARAGAGPPRSRSVTVGPLRRPSLALPLARPSRPACVVGSRPRGAVSRSRSFPCPSPDARSVAALPPWRRSEFPPDLPSARRLQAETPPKGGVFP